MIKLAQSIPLAEQLSRRNDTSRRSLPRCPNPNPNPNRTRLQMLKMSNLEGKVAAAMSQANPKVGLVVPTAQLQWSDKQQPATTAVSNPGRADGVPDKSATHTFEPRLGQVESASSALEAAVRAFDYGQRAATKPERLQLRSAIESARAAGVPETDLAMATQLGQQAEDR